MGLVLGSIRLPTMISVLKMNPSIAIGTNLATSSVMGISGLIGHLLNNEVDFLILIVMGFTAMVGGYIGAGFTHRFGDKHLKRIIGIVLIVVAITMFVRVATIV
ncbi:MAG: sulfite exporter TauE/SafE family protein [Thermoproteota archaeon]|nr:sulfite exporter TauE/SafE family protein [Thermoproteota archaeon]